MSFTINLSGWMALIFIFWNFAIGLVLGLIIDLNKIPKENPNPKPLPREKFQ